MYLAGAPSDDEKKLEFLLEALDTIDPFDNAKEMHARRYS